ncbi:hypothetical protein ACIA5G_52635 [Amycolatopsis sp. NPDC051758]|uniref:hypothetical protein n=1 Tax=Amycolatopsis sp. NPDC051758 TaxID=3363935 RepID=UPI003797D25D
MTTLHENGPTTSVSRHRTLHLLAVAISAALVTASTAATAVAAPVATTTVGSWGPGVNAGGPGFTNQTIRQVVHVSAGGTAPGCVCRTCTAPPHSPSATLISPRSPPEAPRRPARTTG